MKKQILEYSITSGVCLVLAFVICLIRGIFQQTELFRVFMIICDGFFIVGLLTLCMGLLFFVNNNGAFDMLIYGVGRFFSLFKKNHKEVKYATYYDYHLARMERPKADFVYFLVIGGAMIVISLIFLALWSANSQGVY